MVHYLAGTEIEIVNQAIQRGQIRSALFDFDGTLSLIRQGWQQVMIPMMVEILLKTPAAETPAQLTQVVTEYVEYLTGKQTIYQMIRLAEEVHKRGGRPLAPLEYKKIYHARLWARIEKRLTGLQQGTMAPDDLLVPGSVALLASLQQRGVALYLASGTDLTYVQNEARALGLAPYFGPHIYGALDQYQNFSKQMVIDHILHTHGLRGSQLVAFGDGYVEIENTKTVGGIAVGVASDEVRCRGINAWKRERLIQAGADLIIPEFRNHRRLLAYLWGEDET